MNPGASIVGVEREIGLRGRFEDFIPMAWPLVEPGRKYFKNWHISVVCEHLEAVYRGQIRNLILEQPPGTMKSLMVSVFWPAWVWLQDPTIRWLHASYDNGLTIRDARRLTQIVGSPWYVDRWGDRATLPKVFADGDFSLIQGGFRFSTSVNGPVTGRHGDIKVIDDPIKPKNITPVALEACIDWYTGTWSSRNADPTKTRNVLIMQRVHDGDLAGYLTRQGGYEVLRLPMRYVPKACSYTKIGGDMRTDEGELLWPARIPEDAVKELEKHMTANVAAAQLQQDPVPDGGGIFQQSWFQRWTPSTLPARFDQVCQSWDCAFKGTATSDFVVGQVWGQVGPNYYLLDQERGKWSFPQTLDAIRRLTLRWPKVIAKLVEDKANGPAVISSLEKEIPGLIAVDPQGGKVPRANAIAPLYASRNVFHPDPASAPWVADVEQEMLRFPFGVNDDCVDCGSQALGYLYGKKSGYWAALERLAARRKDAAG